MIKEQPVTKLARGLLRKRMASAISSGLAMRPSSTLGASVSCMPDISAQTCLVMFVSTHVGQTQLTRIPSFAWSSATDQRQQLSSSKLCGNDGCLPAVLVIPSTACLEVVYGIM